MSLLGPAFDGMFALSPPSQPFGLQEAYSNPYTNLAQGYAQGMANSQNLANLYNSSAQQNVMAAFNAYNGQANAFAAYTDAEFSPVPQVSRHSVIRRMGFGGKL